MRGAYVPSLINGSETFSQSTSSHRKCPQWYLALTWPTVLYVMVLVHARVGWMEDGTRDGGVTLHSPERRGTMYQWHLDVAARVHSASGRGVLKSSRQWLVALGSMGRRLPWLVLDGDC